MSAAGIALMVILGAGLALVPLAALFRMRGVRRRGAGMPVNQALKALVAVGKSEITLTGSEVAE